MERYLKNMIMNSRDGRTMIEVLIAMAIFTIGFLAIGTMVLSTIRNNSAGNIITQATMLAREKVESLKALPIEQMQQQCAENVRSERLGDIFERVCEVEASFSETVKIVVVTVSWHRRGQNREVVLRTLTRGDGM